MAPSKHLKVENAAEKLGFTDFPLTILYGQPKSIKNYKSDFDRALIFLGLYGHYSGIITDTAIIILKMLEKQYQLKFERLKKINNPSEKPNFFYAYGREKRVHKYFILVPHEKLYIELNNKVKEPARLNLKRHGFQLKIYSTEEDHKFNIANAINNAYEGGFLNRINNWERIEGFFNVKADDCISDWNSLLKPSLTSIAE
ncbi:MAG: hypothetical protein KAV01_01545 [Candidatus Lokiarchaeota archaeon]|nr:hypothetical protein [Candidatus Lokiarchaeota archaeon]MCK4479184.1 hypothetical protein [Candidatus Lokiarchaeota archaeon]